MRSEQGGDGELELRELVGRLGFKKMRSQSRGKQRKVWLIGLEFEMVRDVAMGMTERAAL